jgi:UDP-N-acetylmuramate--alanine ligase
VDEQRPWTGRRLHFVGIGGAGMSGLALVAHRLGAAVTGSDRAESGYTRRLRETGIEPALGHAAENVPEDCEVVHSTAIPAENPERAAARSRGLRELHRGRLLSEVSALRRCLAVAGTHGKTTTASMAVHAMRGAGMDPSYLVGGELRSTGANAGWGAGEWLVVEADESDRSLLTLEPEIAVLTNVELDHHATYGSRLEVEEVFRAFLRGAGRAVVWDRPELLSLVGAGAVDAFEAVEPRLGGSGARFTWEGREVALAVPGLHNARNAAAALTACHAAGADPDAAVRALAGFRGAARRFERLGATPSGAVVHDDYAHHPTEVRATLEAARTLGPRRLVAIFQPHLYSRTRMLAGEFGGALALADMVVVLDVYPARERAEDFPGVSGRLVAQAAAEAGAGRPVAWFPERPGAEAFLRANLRAGDLCLTLGAGDVDALGHALVAADAPVAR